MDITNVKLITTTKYKNDEDEGSYRNSTPYDVLNIIVAIPGGFVSYEINLEKGMKESLENAVKLQGTSK